MRKEGIVASQIIHTLLTGGCKEKSPAPVSNHIDFDEFACLKQTFDFDAYDSEEEWRCIKEDVEEKATLLRTIWRGKTRTSTQAATKAGASAETAHDHADKIGKRLNLGGVMRLDVLISFTIVTLLYFCLGVFFLIYDNSTTHDGQLIVPSLLPYTDQIQPLVLSTSLYVFAFLAGYLVVVFLPWTLFLTFRRRANTGQAVEAIRNFYQTEILGAWAENMRNARERLSLGSPGNIPQSSANNAYFAISIWRRLERIAGRTVIPLNRFVEDQIDLRRFTISISLTLFLIPGIILALILGPQVKSQLFDYIIAQEFGIVMLICLAVSIVVWVLFLIIVLSQAANMHKELKGALAGNPLIPGIGKQVEGLTALEKDVAGLDPFALIIARYMAALEAAKCDKRGC